MGQEEKTLCSSSVTCSIHLSMIVLLCVSLEWIWKSHSQTHGVLYHFRSQEVRISLEIWPGRAWWIQKFSTVSYFMQEEKQTDKTHIYVKVTLLNLRLKATMGQRAAETLIFLGNVWETLSRPIAPNTIRCCLLFCNYTNMSTYAAVHKNVSLCMLSKQREQRPDGG